MCVLWNGKTHICANCPLFWGVNKCTNKQTCCAFCLAVFFWSGAVSQMCSCVFVKWVVFCRNGFLCFVRWAVFVLPRFFSSCCGYFEVGQLRKCVRVFCEMGSFLQKCVRVFCEMGSFCLAKFFSVLLCFFEVGQFHKCICVFCKLGSFSSCCIFLSCCVSFWSWVVTQMGLLSANVCFLFLHNKYK